MKMRNLYLERHERLDRELSSFADVLGEVNESLDRIQQDKIDETTVHKNTRLVYSCNIVYSHCRWTIV